LLAARVIHWAAAGVRGGMHAIAYDQADHRRGWTRVRPVAAMSTEAATAGETFAELIAAIAVRADRSAFAALFGHFAPRVKSYMLRLGAPPPLAEELAQETLLAVWRKAGAFDAAKAAPSTWIFTIARNLRIDAARRERRGEALDDPTDAPDADPAPDAALVAAQSGGRIRHALQKLPPEQAEVVRLAFFSDKPHSEIAAELALPLGTVKSRLRLAMARLRELLGDLA
jgi:RNA polymerase sigma-70 factor (ECF subfamily)